MGGYPCIIKPRVSAHGAKSDITICEDEAELKNAFDTYRERGYQEALIQKFINKDYEILSLGCISNKKGKYEILGGITYKIRELLESATAYGAIIAAYNNGYSEEEAKQTFEVLNLDSKLKLTPVTYLKILEINDSVLTHLAEAGYNGFYDIEYLIQGDEVYMNELNFRHSGLGYVFANDDVNLPYYWACSVLGKPYSVKVTAAKYFMAELVDMVFVKRRVISIGQWLKDVKTVSYFAVYNKHDRRGSIQLISQSFVGRLIRMIKER